MKKVLGILIWGLVGLQVLAVIFIIFSKFFNDDSEVVTLEEAKEVEELFLPIFKKSEITSDIQNRIIGKSYKINDQISLEDLNYLTMAYYDFEGERHNGEMIVNEELADEVLEIFRILYENKYPMERMELIDNYNANDFDSIEANNTSAFCYRNIEGTKKLSLHALGLAIDINPLQNPYVLNGITVHENSKNYVNRANYLYGMITEDDICVKTFKEHGWEWGGDWIDRKDYQHFEKSIEKEEIVNEK